MTAGDVGSNPTSDPGFFALLITGCAEESTAIGAAETVRGWGTIATANQFPSPV